MRTITDIYYDNGPLEEIDQIIQSDRTQRTNSTVVLFTSLVRPALPAPSVATHTPRVLPLDFKARVNSTVVVSLSGYPLILIARHHGGRTNSWYRHQTPRMAAQSIRSGRRQSSFRRYGQAVAATGDFDESTRPAFDTPASYQRIHKNANHVRCQVTDLTIVSYIWCVISRQANYGRLNNA